MAAKSEVWVQSLFFQDVVVFGNWQDSDQETEVLISALGATKQSLPQLVAERARTQKVSVAHFFVLRLSTPLLTLTSLCAPPLPSIQSLLLSRSALTPLICLLVHGPHRTSVVHGPQTKIAASAQRLIRDPRPVMQSKLEETLSSLLKECGLSDKLNDALVWCDKEGAESLGELVEVKMEGDLIEALNLQPVKAKLLRKRLLGRVHFRGFEA